MALAELCGYQDQPRLARDNVFSSEIVNYSKNFLNNMDLALPPFANVSYKSSYVNKNNFRNVLAGGKPLPFYKRRIWPRNKNQIRSRYHNARLSIPKRRRASGGFSCNRRSVHRFPKYEKNRRNQSILAGNSGRRCCRLRVLGSSSREAMPHV